MALLAGGLVLVTAQCAPATQIIVLAPSATPAGAIVPTRAPTVSPPATSTSAPPPAMATGEPTWAPSVEVPTATSTLTPVPSVSVAGQTVPLAVPEASVGSTWSGAVIDASPWSIYPLRGEPGSQIDLALEGTGELRPMLMLLGPDGREIARNLPNPDSAQAQIRGVTLVEPGSHYVVITRQGGRDGLSEGAYTFTVSAGNPNVQVGLFSEETGYESLDTALVSAETPLHDFTFEGKSGDIITAQVTALSEGLDARLELRDALGTLLAANDDDPLGGTLDPAIRSLVLPADGSYSVSVGSFGGTSGEFRLKLSQEGRAGANDHLQAALDVPNSGSIRDDGVFVTDFRAGDQVAGSGRELRVQSLVTFHLPTLPEGTVPDDAQLVLHACSEGGAGFRGAGRLERDGGILRRTGYGSRLHAAPGGSTAAGRSQCLCIGRCVGGRGRRLR